MKWLKVIGSSALMVLGASAFATGNDFICSNKPCTMEADTQTEGVYQQFEFSTEDSFAEWYGSGESQYGAKTLYRIIKPGYSCQWYTLESDSTGARDDTLENCTVYSGVTGMVLTVSELRTKIFKKNYDGNYLACAKLKPNTYTVTFDGNGGTASNSSSKVTFDSTYGSGTAGWKGTARTGWTFLGWFTEAEGGTEITSSTIVSTPEDHTLYAHWSPNEYTVTFNCDEGTVTPNTKSVTYGSAYGELASVEKTGYSLSYWKHHTTGNQVLPTTVVSTADDHSLDAVVTANVYRVTLDACGGEFESAFINPTYVTYKETYGSGSSKGLPGCTLDGYTFEGWYTAISGGYKVENDNQVLITADCTLYARYEAIPTYTVNLDKNGGTGGDDTVYCRKGVAMPEISVPTKAGSEFKGYYANSDGSGTQYYTKDGKSNATWDKDSGATIYAKWGEKTYYITFDFDGGSGGTSNWSAEWQKTPTAISTCPTKKGYIFQGYWTEREMQGTQYVDKSGKFLKLWDIEADDTTLYAGWSPITYEISFAANGGVGTMENQSFTYDEAQSLTLNAFTKAPLHFLKWKRNSTTFYTDGQIVSNLTTEAEAVITLTAVWSETSIVAFDANGGEGEMFPQEFEKGVAQALKSNAFIRIGYTFANWRDDDDDVYDDGEEVTNPAKVGETNVLHAVWTANAYTVHFDANGGSGTMSDQTFVYDQEQALTANAFTAADTIHYFVGWSTNRNATAVMYADKAKVSNLTADADGVVTFYAIWRSDVGDYSRALDCDTLRFEVQESPTWQIISNATNACTGGNDQYVKEGPSGHSSYIYASGFSGSGTLKFHWKADNWESANGINVYVVSDLNDLENNLFATNLYGDAVSGWVSGEWCEAVIKLSGIPEDSYLVFDHDSDNCDYCAIDCLSWTQAGEHPEPTEADAPVISGAAMSEGGTFRVTFAADSRFQYELQKTASLIAPIEWSSFTPASVLKPEADGSVSFEPTIDSSEPQMFYRIQVQQRSE